MERGDSLSPVEAAPQRNRAALHRPWTPESDTEMTVSSPTSGAVKITVIEQQTNQQEMLEFEAAALIAPELEQLHETLKLKWAAQRFLNKSSFPETNKKRILSR